MKCENEKVDRKIKQDKQEEGERTETTSKQKGLVTEIRHKNDYKII